MADEIHVSGRRRRRPDQVTGDDDGAGIPAGKKLRFDGWVKSRKEKEGKDSCSILVSNIDGSTFSLSDLRKLLATIDDHCLKIPIQGKSTKYKIQVSVGDDDDDDKVPSPETINLSSIVDKLKFSDRVLIDSILGRPDGGYGLSSYQIIRIGGWVVTGKLYSDPDLAYLEVNDGSCAANLHVLVDASVSEKLSELIQTGTCVHVDGFLRFSPRIKLKARSIIHVGAVDDPDKYPIRNMNLDPEYLRDFPHLRARDNAIGFVARYRNELAFASHWFFEKHRFLWVTTPIITPSDSGGGSEMFQVTTLINKHGGGLLLLPRKEDGKIDYAQDFFGRQAYLSVSGQLHLESYACALGSVYTFGPAFRADNSHTSRHLAEFWMVESVIAFADLGDIMNCAEAYVKYMCKWLKSIVPTPVPNPFARVTYTEAIKLLEEAVAKGKIVFEKQVEWGNELASEHERYLTDVEFQMKPVIVYNYPKEIKAFYMRLNDDGKTVAAMDLLVPTVGKLIGGSQREERYDVLKKRMKEMEIPVEQYEWYLDLQRYGTVKHSGFGLGFERMLLFVTGLDNIKDVSPFPRYPGKADL